LLLYKDNIFACAKWGDFFEKKSFKKLFENWQNDMTLPAVLKTDRDLDGRR